MIIRTKNGVIMAINLKKSRQYLQDFDFSSLFIEELGWSNPPSGGAIAFKCEGATSI